MLEIDLNLKKVLFLLFKILKHFASFFFSFEGKHWKDWVTKFPSHETTQLYFCLAVALVTFLAIIYLKSCIPF